jgi:hypothetical protein
VYPIVLFLHVFSAFAFFLVHGATAAAMFRLKRERDPERAKALLGIRDLADKWMGYPLLVLLVSGIVLGFMGRWWSQAWIWVALGVFIAVGTSMTFIGRMYHMRVWHAIDPVNQPLPTKREARRPSPASPAELAELLQSGRPALLTAVGVGGLAVIVWLMMLKPF